MHEKERGAMNLNFASGVGRSTRRRESDADPDRLPQQLAPEVNAYLINVVSIANDDALFRKLQQDMRNSQHSVLGSQHAIHMIVQECAKETSRPDVETKLVKLGGGQQEEEMTCEDGNSTAGNRLQFFADLKAKSLSNQQLLIETFRNILHRPPCAA